MTKYASKFIYSNRNYDPRATFLELDNLKN